jgi:peptidoglycan hydrolase-like protein with peptidoglycan-binding domain
MSDDHRRDRDLAALDPWAQSLDRSLTRRNERSPLQGWFHERAGSDLADPEAWVDSLERSRTRRRAVEHNSDLFTGRKKASVAALVAVGAPSVAGLVGIGASAAPALAATQGHMVKRGSRGPAVARLQRALGVTADGIFGPATKRALKSFQRRHGLAVDGIAGPATWGALGHGSAPRAHVSRFASAAGAQLGAARVKELQRGIGVAADGIWGPQTARALVRFQARHGLAVDGIPGPRTFAALTSPRAGVARHGGIGGERAGGSVHRLQQLLGLPADGVFGPQTHRAVLRYQVHHGLTADGVVGPQTWQALGVRSSRTLKMGRSHRAAAASHTGRPGVVSRVIAAASTIATRPYVFGGGHGSFISSGYDCSGSVSYALHGGGLLSAPEDSSALESYGEPGPGRYITIYANAGHAWMTIDGRRYDTSSMSGTGGSRWGGSSRGSSGFVVRHPAGF